MLCQLYDHFVQWIDEVARMAILYSLHLEHYTVKLLTLLSSSHVLIGTLK